MPTELACAELELLKAVLHGSGLPGSRISLDPKLIARRLHINIAQFSERAAPLAARGFVGIRRSRSADDPSASPALCSAIWLTGSGEALLIRTTATAAAPDLPVGGPS
jgi:hypothetical protein